MSKSNFDDIVQYLSQTQLFSAIPDYTRIQLAKTIEIVRLISGEILFTQGDISDFWYILISGKLVSVHSTPSGKLTKIGKINPFEPAGELGALSGQLRSLTIRAVADSILLKIPIEEFAKLCDGYPTFFVQISKLITKRLYSSIKSLTHEKIEHDVTVILPIVRDVNLPEFICNKFCEIASNDFTLDIYKEKVLHSIIHTINEHISDKSLIIFMKHWNRALLEQLHNNITNFSIIFRADEDLYTSTYTKHVLKSLERFPNINLRLILLHSDNVLRPDNTKQFLQSGQFDLHHHLRLNNMSDYQRIIRFMTGSAFSVVLGGGGARGISHLGTLKAIIEQGINVDAIGGSSIGASVAACYALTQDLSKTVQHFERLKQATMKCFKLWHLTWPTVSLFSANPAAKEVHDIMEHRQIEDLWIPYFSVSADLKEHREVIDRQGSLSEAIRSSCSLPAIFPPVVRDGHLLVDGGILNNLPVDIMRYMIGDNHIILAASLAKRGTYEKYYNFPAALPLGRMILNYFGFKSEHYVYPHFFSTFLDSLLLGSSANEEKNCHAADILTRPLLSDFKFVFNSKEKEKNLMDIGYQETALKINEFRQRTSLNQDDSVKKLLTFMITS